MRIFTLAALIVLVSLPVFAADDVSLHGDSSIHFATREEGIAILARRDAFIARLSRFDRQSRMKTEDHVTALSEKAVVIGIH